MSCSIASTTAARPASARSKTSPPARGRSRTRLPRRTSTPSTDDARRAPAARAPPSTLIGSHHPELADRAVQAHELLRRERLGALEDLPRARIGRRASRAFSSSVSARMFSTSSLVDLAAVEQVARALGRDPRMVLEDDRRGQQRVALARLADQHRPAARRCGSSAAARSARAGRSARRTRRRATRRTVWVEQNVRRSAPRGRRPPTASCWRSATRHPRSRRRAARHAPPRARERAPTSARRAAGAPRAAPPPLAPGSIAIVARRGSSASGRGSPTSRSTASSQAGAARRRPRARPPPRAVAGAPHARTTCRKRTLDVDARVVAALEQALRPA